MITTEEIKALREQTGLSIMQCKAALEEAGGDREKAIALLKAKGAEIASKKGGRTLGAGRRDCRSTP
jgi:elongation factor Ts